MIRKLLLKQILQTTKYLLASLCAQCLFVGALWASEIPSTHPKSLDEIITQQRVVTGRVMEQGSNEGIPGVNIIIKGTTNGAVTDVDGNYNLEVPSSESVLVFSSIGFVGQEITVGAQGVINVTLAPDIISLSEVVVVG